jgi:predicted peptidase
MMVGKRVVKCACIILFVFFLGIQGTGAAPADEAVVAPPFPGGTAVAPVVHGYETLIYNGPDGLQMPYYLALPAGYNPQKKYPLVLVLQGGAEVAKPGASLAQDRKLLLSKYYAQVWISAAVQDRWPSFILLPQVVAPDRWVNVPARTGSYRLSAQPGASLSAAKAIMDMLQREYSSIDANRIYVTGLSMGGYGVWEAIERWPDYFAAAAPLSGAGDPTRAGVLVHMPIWAFHGAKDTTVPVSGSRDMIQAIIQAGGHPRYTEFPNEGHDLWQPGHVYSPDTDPAFFTWLFSQKRSSG